MIATNVKVFEKIPFSEYKNLPGHSFSSIRSENENIKVTEKMAFGQRADAYLFTPYEYDGVDISLIRPVVIELKKLLGEAIIYGKPQLSVTCDFIHNGFILQYKGRADLKIHDLILDLKVSELDTMNAIKHFRYDWQIGGYMKAFGCKRGMILSINPRTLKVTTIPINPSFDWWEYNIIKYGKPLTNNGYAATIK
jgi:hypothetical protein